MGKNKKHMQKAAVLLAAVLLVAAFPLSGFAQNVEPPTSAVQRQPESISLPDGRFANPLEGQPESIGLPDGRFVNPLEGQPESIGLPDGRFANPLEGQPESIGLPDGRFANPLEGQPEMPPEDLPEDPPEDPSGSAPEALPTSSEEPAGGSANQGKVDESPIEEGADLAQSSSLPSSGGALGGGKTFVEVEDEEILAEAADLQELFAAPRADVSPDISNVDKITIYDGGAFALDGVMSNDTLGPSSRLEKSDSANSNLIIELLNTAPVQIERIFLAGNVSPNGGLTIQGTGKLIVSYSSDEAEPQPAVVAYEMWVTDAELEVKAINNTTTKAANAIKIGGTITLTRTKLTSVVEANLSPTFGDAGASIRTANLYLLEGSEVFTAGSERNIGAYVTNNVRVEQRSVLHVVSGVGIGLYGYLTVNVVVDGEGSQILANQQDWPAGSGKYGGNGIVSRECIVQNNGEVIAFGVSTGILNDVVHAKSGGVMRSVSNSFGISATHILAESSGTIEGVYERANSFPRHGRGLVVTDGDCIADGGTIYGFGADQMGDGIHGQVSNFVAKNGGSITGVGNNRMVAGIDMLDGNMTAESGGSITGTGAAGIKWFSAAGPAAGKMIVESGGSITGTGFGSAGVLARQELISVKNGVLTARSTNNIGLDNLGSSIVVGEGGLLDVSSVGGVALRLKESSMEVAGGTVLANADYETAFRIEQGDLVVKDGIVRAKSSSNTGLTRDQSGILIEQGNLLMEGGTLSGEATASGVRVQGDIKAKGDAIVKGIAQGRIYFGLTTAAVVSVEGVISATEEAQIIEQYSAPIAELNSTDARKVYEEYLPGVNMTDFRDYGWAVVGAANAIEVTEDGLLAKTNLAHGVLTATRSANPAVTGEVVQLAGSASHRIEMPVKLTSHFVYRTLSYHGGQAGVSGLPPSTQHKDGTKGQVSSMIPTLAGYEFLGWSTGQHGPVTNAPGSFVRMNADVELFACWQKEVASSSSSSSSSTSVSSDSATSGSGASSSGTSSSPSSSSGIAPPAPSTGGDTGGTAGSSSAVSSSHTVPSGGGSSGGGGSSSSAANTAGSGSMSGSGSTSSEGTSSGDASGSWSLLNLVFAAVSAAVSAMFMVGAVIKKSRGEEADQQENSRLSLILKVVALVGGVVSLLLFFVLENLALPMAWVNKWSFVIMPVALAHLLIAGAYLLIRRRNKGWPDDERPAS